MNILDELADYARYRVSEAEKKIPEEEMRNAAEALGGGTGFPFEKALAAPGISFITEVKKASPSKGLIAPDFPYLQIAEAYQKAGASAISCLTEPKWFQGSDQYLKEIAAHVTIPVLRKDFTVSPYMIWQARTLGASAVLLICAILDEQELTEYRNIAESVGLSALVEAHDEKEVEMALRSGAKIIGVNNRNLKDFTVDIRNSERLRKMVPDDIIFVSESGIRTADDVARLYRNGTNAVLIGETLMRSSDKKGMLDELRSQIV
ncbi:MAG: indole-3-glycerol phosphate synthase TrpC [Lachnospiraceae bacterium]|nr:indole-3-glycerol phosphate synthase TrpC [Lachnospiraceae bacterium]